MPINFELLKEELVFSTARSGGSGGQHVNKVETKVILKFYLDDSNALEEKQKELIREKLEKKIDKSGVLSLYNQETRSQKKNKERLIAHFEELIKKALKKKKPRKKTKVPKQVKEKILKDKKFRGELKKNRGKPNLSSD